MDKLSADRLMLLEQARLLLAILSEIVATSDVWWVMSVAAVLLASGTLQQSALTHCPELPCSALSHEPDGD